EARAGVGLPGPGEPGKEPQVFPGDERTPLRHRMDGGQGKAREREIRLDIRERARGGEGRRRGGRGEPENNRAVGRRVEVREARQELRETPWRPGIRRSPRERADVEERHVDFVIVVGEAEPPEWGQKLWQ